MFSLPPVFVLCLFLHFYLLEIIRMNGMVLSPPPFHIFKHLFCKALCSDQLVKAGGGG